jgi:hypothetical protein
VKPFASRFLPRPRLYPACWVALALLMSGLDYLAGPLIQFPIAFVVPVVLASWFSGRAWGLGLAVALPLVRLHFVSLRDVPWEIEYSVVNALIRIAVFGGIALLVDRTARLDRELARRVDALEGLLPICSSCKRIRDEEETWQPIESYIAARSAATFTHGYCPPCAKRYFGEYAEEP